MKGEAFELDVPRGSFFSRALRTPMADLFRGRVVGDRALSQFLSTQSLPRPVVDLIEGVVRKARLWPAEEIDVARELVAHFRDGLEAGKSVEELVGDFGDVNKAAKLTRRAKLRCRPIHWRLRYRTTQVLAVTLPVLLAVHTLILVRFYAGEARVDRAPLAALVSSVNARVDALPEDQRALPIYEAVLAEVKALFDRIPISEDEHSHEEWLLGPRGEYWDQFLELSREDDQLWSNLARAAQLPTLGFRARVIYDNSNSYYHATNMMLHLARFVEGDARRALERQEGRIVYEDVLTLLGMSEHLADNARLSYYLVEMSSIVATRALDVLLETLTSDPSLLSDTQLEGLANRVNAHQFTMDLRGDRIDYQILWDNHYSDDGDGDGWLTPSGLRGMQPVGGRRVLHARSNWLDKAVAPLFALSYPSKKEFTERGHALFDEIEAELARPLWERGYPAGLRWRDGLAQDSRYAPLRNLLPWAIPLAQDECVRQRRDAVLAAIAMERYRRQNGDLPTTLEVLTPAFLREVPRDRFDGEVLRYRMTDGELLLYSVGVDRDDDGGRPTRKESSAYDWLGAHAEEGRVRLMRFDGDWVLWRRPVDFQR